MKQCIKCNKAETSKWYSGPLCRQCYRSQPHVKEKELAIARICNTRYRKDNKEFVTEKTKKWIVANKARYLAQQKQYRENHKAEKLVWQQNDRLNNLNGRIATNLRNRVNISLRRGIKAGSAVKDLGCTIEELKIHLESKFQPGMTWDNWTRDGWHIDHKRPLASLDLTIPEQFKKACHYTNLQPLWAHENLSKGDRYE